MVFYRVRVFRETALLRATTLAKAFAVPSMIGFTAKHMRRLHLSIKGPLKVYDSGQLIRQA